MALKLDMSKAYDRVEWRFLSRLLDKMGFPANWNRLIMNCLSTVTYSFIINGLRVAVLPPNEASDRATLCLHICSLSGSGQQVNMMKSAITFSPNVDPHQKIAIMCSLNLNTAQSHDRYLGLPTFVGCNKRRTFAGLIERVWQKTNSWNNSFFSTGGKEILIKVVAQAIPTYSMSIFKIHSTLCRELGSIVARFWWGSTPTNRKIN
ncbi:hypothetical protein UlMin_035954 [Ulmus minor]